MIKRPQSGETEEDILRMQNEFLSQRAKNPKLQPAAQCVKVQKEPKKSLFVRNRRKDSEKDVNANAEQPPRNAVLISQVQKEILGEIHEKIVGDVNVQPVENFSDIVLGDIVERKFDAPMLNDKSNVEAVAFPTIERKVLIKPLKTGKSIFASNDAGKKQQFNANVASVPTEVLTKLYGSESVIVNNSQIAEEVHKENLDLLSKMSRDDILAEREKLLNTIDPTLLTLLKKKRQEKLNPPAFIPESSTKVCKDPEKTADPEPMDVTDVLTPSNAAFEIIQQSEAENWVHFDVVETDKLKWMRDVDESAKELKPGEKFEARFDWKGVLLPYSVDAISNRSKPDETASVNDDRDLYLHGDEPHRPGYTLQELFRLARSNVMQQRISAFGAIGGILSIYNQGFYDGVLELPISKIFFLLRFGLDDNTPAVLEVVSRALAYLFYNEADETLLDFIFDNPGCQWQPRLETVDMSADIKELNALESLQNQMRQLQVNDEGNRSLFRSDFEDNENESKTSMSDFQLAETNLMECLLRTNILQRLYFILNTVKPENSSVTSCLKILIRLARTNTDIAGKIVANTDLMHCVFKYFLPDLSHIETNLATPQFYYYPQFLCLKLLRILISQNLGIAVRLMNLQLKQSLINYLSYRADIQDAMIKVQIECLRIVRCLLLLRIDDSLYSLDSAFYNMLQWHSNYLKFEVGSPYLLRQHASALLMAISSEPCSAKTNRVLSELLSKCCCAWFYRATRNEVTEFSQTTLLSACLHVVTWALQRDEVVYFHEYIVKYLREFLLSASFNKCLSQLITSSVILRKSNDRRYVHTPLPNVGAVLLHENGPQLIIPQAYSVYFLTTLWRLMELQTCQNRNADNKLLVDALMSPSIVASLVEYLTLLTTNLNHYLCSNFYAKIEVKFVYKLLNCVDLLKHFNSAQILQLAYNYLCCLGAEHIQEIEQLFECIIFNTKYLNVSDLALNKWKDVFVSLVQTHYIIVESSNISLSKSSHTNAILSRDWPYFFFKLMLQNFIDNSTQKTTVDFTERDVLEMTLMLVTQLEDSSSNLNIVTPTEELMYAMAAFMGPESEFLSDEIRPLLRKHLLRFYGKYKDYTFEFDKAALGKCTFESLYSLFVDHFQATSYGDELFGSLVLVPMAQKYDSKWRRRMWSDYAPALCYLNCDESLLINGISAYLEPVEEEESLIKSYAHALSTNDVRVGSLPYKIAKYHVEHFRRKSQK
ncbi:unnamed protein product [Ceratitis capitata]|uniref:(Mediterranean fruit fly) hypothetical protein n=1 Tax=Ceratitis capitata TaxID=7213 RepID=A0A811UWM4_CERCA|nr:unnamed protein product [Ceratitis capitata]